MARQKKSQPAEQAETQPIAPKKKVVAKRGDGEIFICKVRDGKTHRHNVMIRFPEEIITVHGARAVKPAVVVEFEGSRFVCKKIADMSAEQVSEALHNHEDYGIEFWSLSDPVALKENPHVSAGSVSCRYCGRADFSYVEEYQAHVPVCRKLHGEQYIEEEVKRIEKQVEEEPYVPNKPISSEVV